MTPTGSESDQPVRARPPASRLRALLRRSRPAAGWRKAPGALAGTGVLLVAWGVMVHLVQQMPRTTEFAKGTVVAWTLTRPPVGERLHEVTLRLERGSVPELREFRVRRGPASVLPAGAEVTFTRNPTGPWEFHDPELERRNRRTQSLHFVLLVGGGLFCIVNALLVYWRRRGLTVRDSS